MKKIATKVIYGTIDDYLDMDCEFNNIVVQMLKFLILRIVVCLCESLCS